ncbi:endonuclease/exonuclease/phosphatase family protein [Vibrio natriegens]|uniref:endonuclease/exonuclease/phosphatase family protein n=1 Tax=Vibrio natriegens TaxID=691 RepID=UPI0021E8D026|nr:endonuclease/exonuclease/phosphatase family protein [Vibrio natriegens]UYI49708.1 endonuclease/exonuclease/phosphatase family protein [Vibrio natriegens]
MRSLFATAMLVFCSASFAQNSINLTSWNIEWLAINGGKVSRTEDDFAKLSQYVSNSQPDVLAFQEVDSEAAIKKVVGNGYDIYFSDRAQSGNKHLQFSDTNQYTGFAVRKGIPISDPSDFSITRGNSKLRFASYIVINPNKRDEIHLLSVHLKAGCSGAYKNSRECKTLKQQGEALAKWIAAREKSQEKYAILGDFNHNLAYQGDWLWSTMTSNTNAKLVTKDTQAECKVRSNRNPNKTHQFRSIIDHIIVSDSLGSQPARQVIFKSQDVLNYHLSDHCPISTQVRLSAN